MSVGNQLSVAPGGTMVDVYGYATMAVAAIQAQDRQIARLTREVETLRQQCAAGPAASRGVTVSTPRRQLRRLPADRHPKNAWRRH